MKITKHELIEMNACESGLQRFIEQTGGTDQPVDVVDLIGGINTTDDLMWLASKKLPHECVVRFACDCALINIELIKPYTDKYDEIVNFLTNPTTDAAYAAYADADAAARAAAADAAARAAAAAAAAAARAAAAYAAAYAAYADAAAADAAAYAAAEPVNKLMIQMFNEETPNENV